MRSEGSHLPFNGQNFWSHQNFRILLKFLKGVWLMIRRGNVVFVISVLSGKTSEAECQAFPLNEYYARQKPLEWR